MANTGVLRLNEYIGGPDQIKCEQIFPSNQKTLLYDFNQDITSWTFEADYQAIVVDTVQFSRRGEPNFSNSKVIGSFAKVDLTGDDAPDVVSASDGTVKVYVPAGMYTGALVPDARKNVVIVVYSLTWSDDSTPAQINSHRFAFIQNWEPDVTIGDPTEEAGYTAFTLAQGD